MDTLDRRPCIRRQAGSTSFRDGIPEQMELVGGRVTQHDDTDRLSRRMVAVEFKICILLVITVVHVALTCSWIVCSYFG
jgi:hypothetical protein